MKKETSRSITTSGMFRLRRINDIFAGSVFHPFVYNLNDGANTPRRTRGGEAEDKPRDYSKPMSIKFKGVQGLRAYIKLLKTPPIKYDANKKAEEALQALKKQGANL